MTELELRKLLSELRAMPNETEWLEFKTNNWQDIGEYLSALSNSACIHDKTYAYIVFGVEDEKHRIVGTTFSQYQKVKGNEEMLSWLCRLLEPKINIDFYPLQVEGERVMIVRVQSAINTPIKFSGVPYVRIGSYKKKLDKYPEMQRLIWTKEPMSVFEKGVAIRNVNGDDVLGLIDYPSYFELLGLPLPDNRSAIFDRLKKEILISASDELYNITNLGAILFARNLNDYETLFRKSIRVIIYQGKNKLKAIKEQVGQKGYASGFKGLIDYINDRLPMNEELGKVFRKEIKMYPEIAIRELVANAIIHQDFSVSGTCPMVEIFDDRIEITNSGKPLISTLRFVDHNPQSRNEKLAYFMRRMNICEERGSGIDKVISECEYYQLPAPRFIEEDNYTKVILYAHKTLRQMDKEDKIRACYLHACLRYVSGDYMTNQSLRERFGIVEKNYSMASRIISDSIKDGMVKYSDPESNSKKHAKYIPYWA
ncbi:ATP-binding protein [Labilibacter marinus]|uniref:ATP-binding protein n=1 Tax=Labilibacter marinus TaxID=1477105 RepID=UPI00094F9351|nr:ATP-binding protein [Labilibacter marinus]